MSADQRREYGLGSSQPFVRGVPKVVGPTDDPLLFCPHCGCTQLYQIEVRIEGHPLLATGRGMGYYIGCPACPFASPMIMVAGHGDAKKSTDG